MSKYNVIRLGMSMTGSRRYSHSAIRRFSLGVIPARLKRSGKRERNGKQEQIVKCDRISYCK